MRMIAMPMTAVLLGLSGCSAAPVSESASDAVQTDPAAESYSFKPDQYPAVHAVAIEVLRGHGFRIARDDYRFGTITTYPKEAPTAAEFWVDDPTTPTQHRTDTLNAQQRTVTVRVEKRIAPYFDITEPPSNAGRDPDQVPSEADRAYYELTVEVLVQRRQEPTRYLTHSATGRITARYAAVPAHLRDRGIDGPYDQPLTRDPRLEARLLEAIRAAAAE